jgi:hypothetical protein
VREEVVSDASDVDQAGSTDQTPSSAGR